MPIRKKSELMESLKAVIGDSTSDEVISLLEDLDDTLSDDKSDLEKEALSWKEKYEQNDAEWRARYRDRFYSSVDVEDDIIDVEEDEESAPLTYDKLFKED